VSDLFSAFVQVSGFIGAAVIALALLTGANIMLCGVLDGIHFSWTRAYKEAKLSWQNKQAMDRLEKEVKWPLREGN
jgi:hypothetical protein